MPIRWITIFLTSSSVTRSVGAVVELVGRGLRSRDSPDNSGGRHMRDMIVGHNSLCSLNFRKQREEGLRAPSSEGRGKP